MRCMRTVPTLRPCGSCGLVVKHLTCNQKIPSSILGTSWVFSFCIVVWFRNLRDEWRELHVRQFGNGWVMIHQSRVDFAVLTHTEYKCAVFSMVPMSWSIKFAETAHELDDNNYIYTMLTSYFSLQEAIEWLYKHMQRKPCQWLCEDISRILLSIDMFKT